MVAMVLQTTPPPNYHDVLFQVDLKVHLSALALCDFYFFYLCFVFRSILSCVKVINLATSMSIKKQIPPQQASRFDSARMIGVVGGSTVGFNT